MVLNLWFDKPTSVFKLKSLLQLNFIGWGLGKCQRISVCCIVVSQVSNGMTSLFSDGIVSQDMPDVGVTLTPTRPYVAGFSAHLVECC